MQLCLAYRNEGGRVIVVLSQVPKTEMEEMFRYIIPDRERYNSTFVFRQGNPLLPDALRMVAASSASATVIVTDTSRHVLVPATVLALSSISFLRSASPDAAQCRAHVKRL